MLIIKSTVHSTRFTLNGITIILNKIHAHAGNGAKTWGLLGLFMELFMELFMGGCLLVHETSHLQCIVLQKLEVGKAWE